MTVPPSLSRIGYCTAVEHSDEGSTHNRVWLGIHKYTMSALISHWLQETFESVNYFVCTWDRASSLITFLDRIFFFFFFSPTLKCISCCLSCLCLSLCRCAELQERYSLMSNFAVGHLIVWTLFVLTNVLLLCANSLTLLYVAMATEILARNLLMGTNSAIIATVWVKWETESDGGGRRGWKLTEFWLLRGSDIHTY